MIIDEQPRIVSVYIAKQSSHKQKKHRNEAVNSMYLNEAFENRIWNAVISFSSISLFIHFLNIFFIIFRRSLCFIFRCRFLAMEARPMYTYIEWTWTCPPAHLSLLYLLFSTIARQPTDPFRAKRTFSIFIFRLQTQNHFLFFRCCEEQTISTVVFCSISKFEELKQCCKSHTSCVLNAQQSKQHFVWIWPNTRAQRANAKNVYQHTIGELQWEMKRRNKKQLRQTIIIKLWFRRLNNVLISHGNRTRPLVLLSMSIYIYICSVR